MRAWQSSLELRRLAPYLDLGQAGRKGDADGRLRGRHGSERTSGRGIGGAGDGLAMDLAAKFSKTRDRIDFGAVHMVRRMGYSSGGGPG